jgi:hypothetical protein
MINAAKYIMLNGKKASTSSQVEETTLGRVVAATTPGFGSTGYRLARGR